MTATRPALRMARHRSRSLSSAAASAPPTRSVYAPSSSVPKPCVDYMSDAPAVQDPRGNLKTSLSPAPSTPAFNITAASPPVISLARAPEAGLQYHRGKFPRDPPRVQRLHVDAQDRMYDSRPPTREYNSTFISQRQRPDTFPSAHGGRSHLHV
jgi:hypothetical protein